MGWAPTTLVDYCDSDLESWVDQSQGNTRWGVTWATTASNTITWVVDPADPAAGRTVLLQTRGNATASTGGRVGPRNNIDRPLHGQESGTAPCRIMSDIVVIRRFYQTHAAGTTWTGMLTLVQLMDGANQLCRIGLSNASGDIGYILGTGSTPTLSGTNAGQSAWHTLVVRYVAGTGADGILSVILNGVQIINITNHSQTASVSGTGGGVWLDAQIFGTINATHCPILLYTSHSSVIDPLHWLDANIFNQSVATWYTTAEKAWAGINLGSIRHNKASLLYCQPPGAFRHSWLAVTIEVALEYSTDPALAGSTTTAYETAAAADRWYKHINITGLSADTVYYYRFKVRDVAVPGTVENGPIRQFKTLPTTGTMRIGATMCTDQAGSPYEFAQTWLKEGVEWAHHGGDFMYNDSSYSKTGPHSIMADFLREYTLTLSDLLLLRFLHQRHMTVHPSDHDFAEDGQNNDVLGGYQKGYVDIYGHNAAGADGAAYAAADLCQNSLLAGDGVTVPTLWDAGREAWYKAIRAGQPDLAHLATAVANPWEDAEDFESFTPGGNLQLMWIGSREYQNWTASPGFPDPTNDTGGPCMLGSAGEEWFNDAIAAVPAGTKLLVIFMDSVLSDVNTTDDNFQQVAQVQRDRMLNTINTTLATGCKVLFVCGDRHWRALTTGARFISGGPITLLLNDYTQVVLGEVLTGQGSKGILGSGEYIDELANPLGVTYSDGDQVTRSPVNWARFGCIIDIDAPNQSATITFYAYDGTTTDPVGEEFLLGPGESDGGFRGRGRGHVLWGCR